MVKEYLSHCNLVLLLQIEGEESICILFTSGTTGPGKPLTISHRAWSTNLTMVTQPQWNAEPEATGEFLLTVAISLQDDRLELYYYGISWVNNKIIVYLSSEWILWEWIYNVKNRPRSHKVTGKLVKPFRQSHLCLSFAQQHLRGPTPERLSLAGEGGYPQQTGKSLSACQTSDF